ncbi:short chain dehydrogenase family protein [Sphingomonas sp. S17]|uniref:SDR family NAD(P)-dependent oxidoreductase n=2 Tax=Sphingomonas paucimobilis TaxID=13689 RepID=A0A411LF54_SPHPI|nr:MULTISPECIES: SDR family NAD(P)-dependent oxidoreductase [Sphingomonas]EGI56829.1 short chain dehydrogenase family protein [Sphingomonas sp. S17]MBQ1480117.1 SDR family NAD(P)-dependent oxidoreductase [Sphingomonas sp.]MCM3678980.1 SDR family NAD(P)-dependent oxidoreductase [Sphingomonas paucimobilis]MDG5971733.1 SDR family NAD(P)-dependent oxidoreductase [Sphingomonas paucimobilis]NNG58254.1 SDR family NAD(P)-dependent oxidoreductase [Sphingomonas paucimobilis]
MAGKFAIVTGASTGIGYHLAACAAREGYDLVIVADEPAIHAAASKLAAEGAQVQAVEADLATLEGVDTLLATADGRRIDVLCANAGNSRGGAFLDQSVEDWRRSIDTNVTGTVYLLQRVLSAMVRHGEGKVLVTGSIVGFIPGPFNAIYNATKAFIDNFTEALRNELKDEERVTLTTLMPGPTETEFFARADMLDTNVGQSKKDDPAEVARKGWDAMMAGEGHIVPGLKNKAQVAGSGIVPQAVLAEAHRKIAEPGSGHR